VKVSGGLARSAGALLVGISLGLVSCTLPLPVVTESPGPVVVELQQEPTLEPEIVTEPPVEEESVDPVQVRIDSALSAMDLRTKLAGLMVVTVSGMDSSVHQQFLEEVPAAGFLLLSGNLQGDVYAIRDFISALQNVSDFPLIMAVDQEGNPVARIPGDQFPGARVLGAGDLETTAAAFLARQQLVDRAGANVNFGVVADVSLGSGAYIHSRSFSTDPAVAAEHVAVAASAAVGEVAQTLKHFPGHGLVYADSHRVVPSSDITFESWRQTHAVPFEAGIDAGAELVMTGHIRVPSVSKDPATLSDDWVRILREDLGFQGVIITDDLRMLRNSGEAAYQDPAVLAVAALVSGHDLIMLAVDPARDPSYQTYTLMLDAMEQAVLDGVVSVEQVDLSLRRVLALRTVLGTP
jgi:beta-N-acetylhexosaminidase